MQDVSASRGYGGCRGKVLGKAAGPVLQARHAEWQLQGEEKGMWATGSPEPRGSLLSAPHPPWSPCFILFPGLLAGHQRAASSRGFPCERSRADPFLM